MIRQTHIIALTFSLIALAACDDSVLVAPDSSDATSLGGDEALTPENGLFYPNPFNPSTTIQYEMAEPAYTRLTVFDVFGRTVRELVAGQLPAGRHSVVWDARNQSSGVYFYRLETEDFVETKSMFLAK